MKTHIPRGSRTLCGLKLIPGRPGEPHSWKPSCVDLLYDEAPTCKHCLTKRKPVEAIQERKNYSGQHATARRTVNIPEADAARIEAKARARKMTLVAFIVAAAEAFAGCAEPVDTESVAQQTEAPEVQLATQCDGDGQCVTCDGRPSSRRLIAVPSGLWNPSTDRWTLVDRDGAAFSWCRD